MRIVLPGYGLGQLIRNTRTTEVYHAIREHDQLPVIAKSYVSVELEAAEGWF